jgi:hypothetical protein
MNLDLTEREVQLLMMCIETNIETIKRRHNEDDPEIADLIFELQDLDTDLFELSARPCQRRPDPDLDTTDLDLTGLTFTVAETDFIDHGVRAREMQKASSRAADRRNFNLKGPDPKLSPTQTHDVWDANDPKNW